jgi:hypothetical protein
MTDEVLISPHTYTVKIKLPIFFNIERPIQQSENLSLSYDPSALLRGEREFTKL